jgi:hypothetical protein
MCGLRYAEVTLRARFEATRFFHGQARIRAQLGRDGTKQALPWMMLCCVSVVFNALGDVPGLMSCKRSSENGQVLVGFQSTEAFGCLHHAGGPAQRHRGISPSLHVATDAAHVPIMFSIELVQASERLSFTGKPRRLTVSISSSPSRMLAATAGASWSSRRARLRNSRSALSASSSSQACRSARRTDACSGLGSRSITLRAL